MERGNKSSGTQKRRRRITLLWAAVVVGVIIALLSLEQIALLYVLATLSVVVLLLIVAWADLSGSRGRTTEPAPFDDAAAIADGQTAARTATVNSMRAASTKRRSR